MTGEILHEVGPRFGTENKIFQYLRCYTCFFDFDSQRRYAFKFIALI